MDRRVKERLVGATILGVLIVLLVPELLSGPKPAAAPAANPTQPVRSVTVDLTTRQSVAPTPIPPASPASAAPDPASVAGASTPPSAPAPAADAPTAVESAGSSPISTVSDTGHRGWALQAGSFASRENADKLVRQLKAHNYAVYVVSGGSGAALRHKVRIGPLADRAAAERLLAKLKAQRFSASIVAPDSRQ
jgi:DedD protein